MSLRGRGEAPLHQLHLGALRADDVVAVGDEAAPDQRSFAARADEAIVVPVPVLEGDEASAADTWKNPGRAVQYGGSDIAAPKVST